MVRRSIGGVERDYLLLDYKSGDKLYVPSDQVDLLRPYTGGEAPALSRLNGADWQRTKSRVRAAVREIAQELVVLYQKRVNSAGHAFGPDTPWQRELEESFPYVETPDQLKAIDDVKVDMEADAPMDRLVCGDVGFGKTEVAIRAAFKAVQDGKQAAVLVPTTLLASQHFQTFSDRFAGYPVRVEMLSRFLTPAQTRQVIDGLADGSVDVVIGTHRLLSGDLIFKDLGLLVVDEEQRFGVTHKEAIKKLRTDVDVLTLTATPIPRTLEMSLTGIRDLTLLNTPPADRQPILTYVGEYDDRAVAEAVRRELLREGQVFYVHNRIVDIEKVAAELRGLVPEARVAVAHGQMDEGALERVVLDFWEGEYDVLVCTTIIESGIDMPTVNTLVVDRADRLGLGQLHQLRGRVGRAGQRAYAYLLFPADQALSEEAYERLRTIGEHTELGSGFQIAMRDLEIRGAGNLLGGDQSGHIAAVGYDLYVQMVSEAVAELKGEELRPPAEIKLDLPVTANLPRRLRVAGGPPARGLSPAGDGDHPRRGRRHRVGVARPLRPAAGAGAGAAAHRPPAGRVRPAGHPGGGGGHGRRRRWSGGGLHRPAGADRAQGQPAGPADPPGAQGGVQGGHRSTGAPAAAGGGPRRRPGRLARATVSTGSISGAVKPVRRILAGAVALAVPVFAATACDVSPYAVRVNNQVIKQTGRQRRAARLGRQLRLRGRASIRSNSSLRPYRRRRRPRHVQHVVGRQHPQWHDRGRRRSTSN